MATQEKCGVKRHAPPPLSKRILDSELGLVSLVLVAAYYAGAPWARQWLWLSYGYGNDVFGKGRQDICFVVYWVVAFTFLRAVLMNISCTTASTG
ncbi:hypothetical protein BDF14DRAFT_621355 [Spinellus fusiger]|nr:hypothetical protein BDF14DRAFT_621355 [Spinellus fusiger]